MASSNDNQTVRLLKEQVSALPGWLQRHALLSGREALLRPEVGEHAYRVAGFAAELAGNLGMDRAAIWNIHEAARLHDVGKLAVDDAILYKPGRLDEAEFEEMKRHAAYGHALLEAAGAPPVFSEIALYHHERYDGHGYEGLKGEEIPLAARIVQVADVYEALTARRAYKAAVAPEDALLQMVADVPSPGFGRRAFDPGLLRVFVRDRLENDPAFAPSPEAGYDAWLRNGKLYDLKQFAASDPMADYGPGELPAGLVIKGSGARLLFETDETGAHAELLAVVTRDGRLANRSDMPEDELRARMTGVELEAATSVCRVA